MSDTNDEQHKASAGGHARAAKLTPEERREIAKHAARVRWANRADDRKLSPKEIERLALTYAIQDREAMVQAAGPDSEEGKRAAELVEVFKARLRSRYGEGALNGVAHEVGEEEGV